MLTNLGPQAIAQDRSAYPSAELLQIIVWLWKAIGVGEGVIGLERRVAVVIKRFAMESVGPRSRHRVDKALSAAINGRVRADSNLKLLNPVFPVEVGDAIASEDIAEVIAGRIGSVYSK